VPVIMLTVRGEEEERIKGLDLGADDYMTKPFSARELVSRINAVLRRVELSSPDERTSHVVVDDRLRVDFDRREVLVDGEPAKLRPTEYRLLYHFLQNPGRVLTMSSCCPKCGGRST
jgi:DNA-binding response OmpR family regulator